MTARLWSALSCVFVRWPCSRCRQWFWIFVRIFSWCKPLYLLVSAAENDFGVGSCCSYIDFLDLCGWIRVFFGCAWWLLAPDLACQRHADLMALLRGYLSFAEALVGMECHHAVCFTKLIYCSISLVQFHDCSVHHTGTWKMCKMCSVHSSNMKAVFHSGALWTYNSSWK